METDKLRYKGLHSSEFLKSRIWKKMEEQKIIQWGLSLFLVVSPTAIFAEISTGYDGAGNYVEDAVIDEKKNRKLVIDRFESKRQEIIEKIKKNPDNYLYHYYLGDIYLEMKRPEKAVVSFKEAVKLNPRNGKAHYQLAKAYGRTNDTSRAIRHIAIASQIFEDNFDLHWKTKANVFLLQLREQD